jgi:penicillin-binding protein 2
VDLPGEREGLITPPRKKALGDVYNLAIGQGKTLVTPLQMVRMISVAANGGWLVRPHVLLKTTDRNGAVLTPPLRDEDYREKKPLPIPAADLALLREAFRRVVTEGTVSNTAEKDFLVEAGVAGKSGTAQTADKEVNHGWLAGYVPYDRPRLAFVILAEKVPGHGGETCAPILQAFLEEYSRLADQRRLAKASY